MSVPVKCPDVIHRPEPDAVKLKGFVGKRFDLSRLNRLHDQEEDHLLWPFHEHCPVGRWDRPDRPHPEIRGDWQGEYIGTWLDAAILSAWNAGDDELRNKIGAMVADWLSTQQADGYLGTIPEEDRWESWDVWVQAHDLIGLMSYYRYTGSKKVLDAAVRVADRVLQDFGPGKRYLHPTGPHGGMASSSFLEPLIWLYWETGKEEYLEWGKWLVDEDWEQPQGPRIVSSLMAGRGVAGTANAKGIEMLICFAGMVEMYRATGDTHYVQPVLAAWDDIVEHQLYITGSASTGEHFMADYTLRNDGVYMLGETCVSMGWLYLNLKLGRLLGEARFFDMAEQTLYNHLLAAQSPDGRGWAYYVGLRDSKRYRWHVDPECCPTRGVRALAQMPTHAFGIGDEGIVVNYYDAAEGKMVLQSGAEVAVELEGDYPFDGRATLRVQPAEPTEFTLRLRLPGWCQDWELGVNGEEQDMRLDDKGYLVVDRVWSPGDEVELKMDMPVRIVVDALGNMGRVALARGPLVFAADTAYLPAGRLLDDVILLLDRAHPAKGVRVVRDQEAGSMHLVVPTVIEKPGTGAGWWREKERYNDLGGGSGTETVGEIEVVPFFEAGNHDNDIYRDGFWTNTERVAKITYQVWLPYRHC
jgi:DUF1680 family protein